MGFPFFGPQAVVEYDIDLCHLLFLGRIHEFDIWIFFLNLCQLIQKAHGLGRSQ